MSKRKLSFIEKSTKIHDEALVTMWCIVDTENEFTFADTTFVIDKEVEEYKVFKPYGIVDDYTNESEMDKILVVIDKEKSIKFYNQKYEPINSELVKAKE